MRYRGTMPSADPLSRIVALTLAAFFGLFALYACWSIPDLVGRWGVSATGGVVFVGWAGVAGWALSTGWRRARRAEWACFAIVALAFRLGSLALVVGRYSLSDPHRYYLLASRLLGGQGLNVYDWALQVRVYAEFPPAYPVLLAGWGAVFGLSAVSILALSTVLDAATALLLARFGDRLGHRRAGRAAAALYLIWPSALFAAPLAQKESLEMLLILALAHLWVQARDTHDAAEGSVATILGLGTTAAVLALTQPGMAALAPIFGVAMLPAMGWRRFCRIAIPAAAVAVLAMIPWWVRNWQVLGAFVPLTSIGGLSLWIGENATATGNWMPYPETIKGLGERASAAAAGHIAVDWIVHHPLAAVRLNLAKLFRAVGVGQFAITRLAAMRPRLADGVTAALLPLSHGAQIILLAAGSAALGLHRSAAGTLRCDPVLVALLAGMTAQIILFGVWFEFGERHRELLTPFLLLAVAIAASRFVASIGRRAGVSNGTAPVPIADID